MPGHKLRDSQARAMSAFESEKQNPLTSRHLPIVNFEINFISYFCFFVVSMRWEGRKPTEWKSQQ